MGHAQQIVDSFSTVHGSAAFNMMCSILSLYPRSWHHQTTQQICRRSAAPLPGP